VPFEVLDCNRVRPVNGASYSLHLSPRLSRHQRNIIHRLVFTTKLISSPNSQLAVPRLLFKPKRTYSGLWARDSFLVALPIRLIPILMKLGTLWRRRVTLDVRHSSVKEMGPFLWGSRLENVQNLTQGCPLCDSAVQQSTPSWPQQQAIINRATSNCLVACRRFSTYQ
jgi:hypothetical protein